MTKKLLRELIQSLDTGFSSFQIDIILNDINFEELSIEKLNYYLDEVRDCRVKLGILKENFILNAKINKKNINEENDKGEESKLNSIKLLIDTVELKEHHLEQAIASPFRLFTKHFLEYRNKNKKEREHDNSPLNYNLRTIIDTQEDFKFPKNKTIFGPEFEPESDFTKSTCIISKFSRLTKIKNKKEELRIKLETVFNTFRFRELSQTKAVFDNLNERRVKNIRTNMSGVSSIVYVEQEKLFNQFNTLLFNKSNKVQLFIEELSEINIKNIFIILNDSLVTEFEGIPNFTNFFKINSETKIKSSINFSQLTLDDFCSLYSIIQNNLHTLRGNKIKLSDGILLKSLLTVDESTLYKHIFSSFDFNNSIFIFVNTPWNRVIANMKKFNIDISGGSSVKRHLVSPMDHNISLFLSKMFGAKNSYKEIVYSNYSLKKSLYKSDISDFSLKDLTHRKLYFARRLNYSLLKLFKISLLEVFDEYDILNNLNESETLKKKFIDSFYKTVLNEIIFSSKNLDNYLSQGTINSEEHYIKEIINLKEKILSNL